MRRTAQAPEAGADLELEAAEVEVAPDGVDLPAVVPKTGRDVTQRAAQPPAPQCHVHDDAPLLESHRAHLDPGQAQKMLEYGGDAHGCPTLPGLLNTRGL